MTVKRVLAFGGLGCFGLVAYMALYVGFIAGLVYAVIWVLKKTGIV
jgi:hypothetical protein